MRTRILILTMTVLCLSPGLHFTPSAYAQDLLHMLVGTYTEGSTSEGVYLYTFNQEDGTATLLDSAPAGNPSFVVADKKGRYAYSVNEYNDGRQAVSSYSLKDDKIRLLNSEPTDFGEISGADPCNLLLMDKFLISSNYTGGSITVFEVEWRGTLSPQQQCFTFSEVKTTKALWSKKKKKQDAHMHCAVLTPDGKYVLATNLGNDCIHRFKIVEGESPLVDDGFAFEYSRHRQAGPRHMVFSADGKFAYLLCELDDLLTVFSYNDGMLTELMTISAYGGKGHGSADIHLSPDGKYLYTSHRLAGDGISVFSVDPSTGLVKNIGFHPTGRHPRNFAITPNGKYLLCACRDDDVIEVYSISPDSGLLKATGQTIRLGKPVCVQFY